MLWGLFTMVPLTTAAVQVVIYSGVARGREVFFHAVIKYNRFQGRNLEGRGTRRGLATSTTTRKLWSCAEYGTLPPRAL